jgi:hypothetical protein
MKVTYLSEAQRANPNRMTEASAVGVLAAGGGLKFHSRRGDLDIPQVNELEVVGSRFPRGRAVFVVLATCSFFTLLLLTAVALGESLNREVIIFAISMCGVSIASMALAVMLHQRMRPWLQVRGIDGEGNAGVWNFRVNWPQSQAELLLLVQGA